MKRLLIVLVFLTPCLSWAQIDPEAESFQNEVVNKVMAYNDENDKLREALTKARENKQPDTVRINQQLKETVAKCFQVPQDFIGSNPSSLYSLQALQMLGKGGKNSPVQIPDLIRLFNSLSSAIKNSPGGRSYGQQLINWPWMKKLKQAVEDSFILNSILQKEAGQQLQQAVWTKALINKYKLQNEKLSSSQLSDKIKASTLIVNMAYKKKEDNGTSININPTTAYVIDAAGVCVTNYHVIKEYGGKGVYFSLSVMTAEGISYPVKKILAASEADDLAIFQVNTRGDQLTPIPIGEPAAEGTNIYVLSHPLQNFYVFTPGVVAGYKMSTLANSPCTIMSITAEFNVGSSGGPIIDEYGNLVGTVSRLSKNGDGTTHKTGIPVSELRKLIEFEK